MINTINVLPYELELLAAKDGENTIGEKVRSRRLSLGLTQKDLAVSIDASENYICLIETGAKKPSMKFLDRIAKALCISIRQLIEEDIIMEDIQELAKKYNIDLILSKLQNLKEQQISLNAPKD